MERRKYPRFFYFKGENYFDELHKLPINIKCWELPEKLKNNYGELTPSVASDFFKFKELSENKDIVFADLDIIFLKNIDSLIDNIKKNKCTNALSFCGYFSVGVLVSLEDDVMFNNVYNRMINSYKMESYQGAWAHILNKYKSIDELNNKLGGKSFNIDMNLFYKLDSFNINKIWGKGESISDDQLGIHWYAGHQLSQEWNNKLSSSNWDKYDNYLISAIKKSENKV